MYTNTVVVIVLGQVKKLQLIADSGLILSLACGLGLPLLLLLLAIAAGSNLLLRRGYVSIRSSGNHSLLVHALDIRVGRRNTGDHLFGMAGNLIAVLINNTDAGLVLGLELDLAFQGLDLLRIEKVTVLVAVLDGLLLRNDLRLSHGRLRDDGLLIHWWDSDILDNGSLSLRDLGCGNLSIRELSRRGSGLAGLSSEKGILVILIKEVSNVILQAW